MEPVEDRPARLPAYLVILFHLLASAAAFAVVCGLVFIRIASGWQAGTFLEAHPWVPYVISVVCFLVGAGLTFLLCREQLLRCLFIASAAVFLILLVLSSQSFWPEAMNSARMVVPLAVGWASTFVFLLVRLLQRPSLGVISSLLVPGLGQVLRKEYGRGIGLFVAVAALVGLIFWQNMPFLFPVVAVVWLWGAWDVRERDRAAPTGSIAPFMLAALVVYVIGMGATEFDLQRLPTGWQNIRPIVSALFRPELLAQPTEDLEGYTPIWVPCIDPLPPQGLPGSTDPRLQTSVTCAAMGETITVQGEGFFPEFEAEIWWQSPIGDYQRVLRDGEPLMVPTDAQGHISVTFAVPSTAVPKDRLPGPGETLSHRAVIRQHRPYGNLQPTDTLNLVLDKTGETIALAFVATVLALVFAVPLGLLAARNLMRQIQLTMGSLGVILLCLPGGLALGWVLSLGVRWLLDLGLGFGLSIHVGLPVLAVVLAAFYLVAFKGWPRLGPLNNRWLDGLVRYARLLVVTVLVLLAIGLLCGLAVLLGSAMSKDVGLTVQEIVSLLVLVPVPVLALLAGVVVVSSPVNALVNRLLDRVRDRRVQRLLGIVPGVLAGGGIFYLVYLLVQFASEGTTGYLLFPLVAAGVALGGIVGFALGANRTIPLGLIIYYVVRTLLNLIRSIETLIWAIIFVVWVGQNAFAGMLALFLHSIAALGKLYSETIEAIDPGPVEAIRATGASWAQMVVYAVLPQFLPSFMGFTLLRWDINVRMATVIGLICDAGLGFLIIQWIRLSRYNSMATAVIAVVLVVAILDYASAALRKRIIEGRPAEARRARLRRPRLAPSAKAVEPLESPRRPGLRAALPWRSVGRYIVPILAVGVFVAGLVWSWGVAGIEGAEFAEGTERGLAMARDFLVPSLVERPTEEITATVALAVPCGVAEPAAPATSGPRVVLSLACGDAGDPLVIEGYELPPNTRLSVRWVLPDGGYLRVKKDCCDTDAQGYLRVETTIHPLMEVDPAAGETGPASVGVSWKREIGGPQPSAALITVLNLSLVTLLMALVATTLGSGLAIPLSFLGASNITGRGAVGRVVYNAARLVFNLWRSVEPLILAVVCATWVGFGPFAGTLALGLWSIPNLAKLFYETIEEIDPGSVEAVQATGANRLQVLIFAVVPQLVPRFLAYILYQWDINIRMSTVIGFVGAGGVGKQLREWVQMNQYSEAATAVWAIVVMVWTMDYISAKVREKLT